MGESYAIGGLITKRAELSGKILELDRQRADLKSDLAHIDRCLTLFGYDKPPSGIKPKRPRTALFERRELADLLRSIGLNNTLTHRETAMEIMRRKAWDIDDLDLVRRITESVKSGRKTMRRKRQAFDTGV